jgi:hypothetical protein
MAGKGDQSHLSKLLDQLLGLLGMLIPRKAERLLRK